MAAVLLIMPVVGEGETHVETVHVDDLAAGIVDLLRTGPGRQVVLELAGPDRLPIAQLVGGYRAWLGLRPIRVVPVPIRVSAFVTGFGDLTRMHLVAATMLARFQAKLAGNSAAVERTTGLRARVFLSSPEMPEATTIGIVNVVVGLGLLNGWKLKRTAWTQMM